jgi:hypothetical protein
MTDSLKKLAEEMRVGPGHATPREWAARLDVMRERLLDSIRLAEQGYTGEIVEGKEHPITERLRFIAGEAEETE